MNSDFDQLFVTQLDVIKISTPRQPAVVKRERLNSLGLHVRLGFQFQPLICIIKQGR